MLLVCVKEMIVISNKSALVVLPIVCLISITTGVHEIVNKGNILLWGIIIISLYSETELHHVRSLIGNKFEQQA